MPEPEPVKRDGFIYSLGRLTTEIGGFERMTRYALEAMFMPNLTEVGRKMLERHPSFIRAQLWHYDVDVGEELLGAQGLELLKRHIINGRLNTVPERIRDLEREMHSEWAKSCTPQKLCDYPEWVMMLYFRPNRTITPNPIYISFPRNCKARVSRMENAACKIKGLHYFTAVGATTEVVFLGWDKAAVEKQVLMRTGSDIGDMEMAQKRAARRLQEHAEYCAQPNKVASPVGRYVLECREVEEKHPDRADMTHLDIHASREPGVFEVEFDLGFSGGVLSTSVDENVRGKYRAQEAEPGEGQHGGGSKEQKYTPVVYQLTFRRRVSEVLVETRVGTLRFNGDQLSSFLGNAIAYNPDSPFHDVELIFLGQKVSDTPEEKGKKWADSSKSP